MQNWDVTFIELLDVFIKGKSMRKPLYHVFVTLEKVRLHGYVGERSILKKFTYDHGRSI